MNHVINEIRENPGVCALAVVGAAQGVYEVFVKPARTSTKAWGALALGVVAYEALCPWGETLSEGADRALESHKLLTLGAIGVTALHLSNALPERLDPFHQALKIFKGAAPAQPV